MPLSEGPRRRVSTTPRSSSKTNMLLAGALAAAASLFAAAGCKGTEPATAVKDSYGLGAEKGIASEQIAQLEAKVGKQAKCDEVAANVTKFGDEMKTSHHPAGEGEDLEPIGEGERIETRALQAKLSCLQAVEGGNVAPAAKPTTAPFPTVAPSASPTAPASTAKPGAFPPPPKF